MKHKHLIIRAEVNRPFVDEEVVRKWLIDLVEAIKMNITEHGGPHVDYVNKENNCGIAAVVMIETSHLSLHIWDQVDPPLVQMDVYSCSDFELKDVFKFLQDMEPVKIDYVVLDRKFSIKSSWFKEFWKRIFSRLLCLQ